MQKINILITGTGAPGAPSIIQSLRVINRKIKIIGVDMDENSVGFSMVDKYYLVRPAENKNFIKDILQIAKKEKIDVIIPLVTKELLKFSENKKLFEKENIKVSISDPLGLKIANNKYLLMKHCLKENIPVPEFKLVKNYNEFKRAVFDLGYPKNNVCFKPPVSNGMRGFRILTKSINRLDILLNQKPDDVLTSLEEIAPVLKGAKSFPDLLVMEYLPGQEYSVDILVDNGRCIVVVPRSRDKLKMGISFVGTTVKDQEIIKYSKKIVETLKLNGNIGLQFKRDKKEIPKIIESNPRVQGTMVLATASKANLVYGAVQLCLGEKIKPFKIAWGTKMIRYWKEVYYDKRGHSFTL
ncbi:MAG: ATP-grasp domain-containing protein [Patescibacteria group bacterium]|nr:ATP-grasp domain-containing protein [Patescibacteria group bacterium]